jgi:uncharacterized coiled-coil protein SlyX
MTDESDEDWHGEAPPIPLQRRRRAPLVLALVAGLALAGAGAALVWMNLDGVVRLLGREGSESAEPTAGDKAMLTDLLATQQKTGEDLETLKGAVAEQQEQLKTIVDQLASLTSRLEQLRNAAAPQSPVPQSPPPAVTEPDVRAQIAPKAPKKRAAKPGPISVGGAPLPPRADGH